MNSQQKYKPIVEETRRWPVVVLSRNSETFIEDVRKEAIVRIKEITGSKAVLIEELETTLYREKLRVKRNPWKVDPPDDMDFWNDVRSRLVGISTNGSEESDIDQILDEIVDRYANEILSKFKPSSYRFARRVVKFGFGRLLNASRVKGWGSLWSKKYTLNDKILIEGEVDQLRNLGNKGTVVMVPTHFSNMDSILVGWVIHSMGLPPFIYGAGLNLFNISILAYFMNSLGAYKVDRRKKNMIYIETLKAYSNVAIQKGCHSLFFPGGTRSRSGKIERHLKRGLLNSVVDAQRIIYENDNPEGPKKVFVVPVTLNYHFVLEAPALINQYLKIKGQERYYVENDEYSSSYRILKFLFKFFTKGSDISVSVGQAMDVLGNHVDFEGNSLDGSGRKISTRDYFMKNGVVTYDKQRDEEYTKRLSKVIVDDYHRIGAVFSSHLVAFTAFEILSKRYSKLDLYNLLRLPDDDIIIEYEEFKESFSKLREVIFQWHKEGKINISNRLKGDIDAVIKLGINNVGMYHASRPLIITKDKNISSQSLNTLYYYRNRLDGYGLEEYL